MGISVFGQTKERATRFELANSSLGSYCLTTWRRPLELGYNFTAIDKFRKIFSYLALI
jgi:hypothetical protein